MNKKKNKNGRNIRKEIIIIKNEDKQKKLTDIELGLEEHTYIL